MPTALEAGRYHSNGLRLQRQVHCGSATGLPAPSICASAASNSGEITGVEWLRKSGPYSRQVAVGVFTSAWPTGKNIPAGLRQVCTTQFAAAQTIAAAARMTTTRAVTGAVRNIRSACCILGRSLFIILGYPIR